ncbi:MAG: diguanylate cyclase [Chloroflexi bacterium]|nr:MAG: diguanylate cyclase [Chloroflexota bacterium]MBL1195650.1 diguanylate cyclase [Chloroflexota bacterium]NOH12938.1 diguanylate cyclase [Chloroflexota bacterium]
MLDTLEIIESFSYTYMEKLSVLIAEDDPVQRKMLVSLLTQLGLHVRTAEDGQEAWEQLQEQPAHLVITDWLMPGMSGKELVEKIRGEKFDHYIYIILLTSKDDSGDLVSGLTAGADDYVTKPFNPKELEARISVAQRILKLEDELLNTKSELERLAAYDGLTGLLNRRAFTERAEVELNRAKRENWPAGVIFFDIDNFKQFNDTYGHAVGDEVLQHLASVVSSAIRPYDLFGRWAGDEFICLITASFEESTQTIAERIRKQVASSTIRTSNGAIPVTVSVGMAYQNELQEASLDALLLDADKALYEAKGKGRNRIAVISN